MTPIVHHVNQQRKLGFSAVGVLIHLFASLAERKSQRVDMVISKGRSAPSLSMTDDCRGGQEQSTDSGEAVFWLDDPGVNASCWILLVNRIGSAIGAIVFGGIRDC